jgi:multiple antibiotic resistance protein
MSEAPSSIATARTKVLTDRTLKFNALFSWFFALQYQGLVTERTATRYVLITVAVLSFLLFPVTVWAEKKAPIPGVIEYFPMTHIATFLALMLGPSKIIGPFVSLTKGAEGELERKIALLSVAFSGVALLLAGLLGEMILLKYGIPLPVLALAGGIILFVVALLETAGPAKPDAKNKDQTEHETPKVQLALTPLAFPTIVPPYGIAALIVFLAFTPDIYGRVTIGLIVILIMLANLIAMIFARRLVAVMGTGLAVVGAVLSVIQVALGLQIIHNSLLALRVL